MTKYYQHGDVLLKRVVLDTPETLEQIKEDGVPRVAEDEKILVMAGETGHLHVLEAKEGVSVWDSKGTAYIHIPPGDSVLITHEEHEPMTIPAGLYTINQVREHDPVQEKTRYVYD